MATVSEIAPDLFRISAFVPEFNLQFNQFLVRDAEPLLFHTGPRGMFAAVRDAVTTVLDPKTIRWIGFSHVEADECGSLPEWQALAPQSTAVCSLVGKLVSVDDCMATRPALGMQDGEVLTTGKYRFRFLHTPHVPPLLGGGVLVRGDAADALVFGSLSPGRRCRGIHADGCDRPMPAGAGRVSAGPLGQLYALFHPHGSDTSAPGGSAAKNLGDDAWLGLRRRRRPRAPRPGCCAQRGVGLEIVGPVGLSRLRSVLRG